MRPSCERCNKSARLVAFVSCRSTTEGPGCSKSPTGSKSSACPSTFSVLLKTELISLFFHDGESPTPDPGLFVAEERGSHELKGVPEPVTLFQLVRAAADGAQGNAISRRLSSSLPVLAPSRNRLRRLPGRIKART